MALVSAGEGTGTLDRALGEVAMLYQQRLGLDLGD